MVSEYTPIALLGRDALCRVYNKVCTRRLSGGSAKLFHQSFETTKKKLQEAPALALLDYTVNNCHMDWRLTAGSLVACGLLLFYITHTVINYAVCCRKNKINLQKTC